jgi:hypothetical protein
VNYDTSGIPDSAFLKKLGSSLGIDAFIQGRLTNVAQQDGSFGTGAQGQTRVTVRYDMLGIESGRLLWNAVSEGSVNTAGRMGYTAPPVAEAIDAAVDKILGTLPLGTSSQ